MSTIKVLIVDDSPTVQRIFSKGLARADGIEVVGVAPDPYAARDMIVKTPPDVLTLDIDMPRMDGLTFLRKLMKHFPLPVVVVSTLTADGSQKAMEALASGAVEVLEKTLTEDKINELMLELVRKVRAAAGARVGTKAFGSHLATSRPAKKPLPAIQGGADKVLAIGSSTGGTEALANILERLPADTPGTIIVQHMPPGFTAQMAVRLDGLSAMNVREAVDGDVIEQGVALVAPGDRHLVVHKKGSRYVIELRDGPRVSRHKPSVDVQFSSVAKAVGADAVGVILTGMGRDGAQGLLEMRQAGAHTIGQDEASCVVYGMPREAMELGAVAEEASLNRVADRICAAFVTCRV